MNIYEWLKEADAVDFGTYYIVRCPECGRREAYMYKDDIENAGRTGRKIPIRCNRLNKCGKVSYIEPKDVEMQMDTEITEEMRKEQRRREAAKLVSPAAAKWFSTLMDSVAWLKDYDFDIRGISNATLKKYKLAYIKDGWISLVSRFSEEDVGKAYRGKNYEGRDLIIPLYNISGQLERLLLRSLNREQEKKEIQCRLEKGAEEVFNIQCLKSDAKVIFICEGAFDALSVIEACGSPYVEAVGLPGVGKVKKFYDVVKKVPEAKDKYFVFAFDNDDAGHKYQHEGISIFKQGNYKTFSYNVFSHKDLNEFLQNDRKTFEKSLKKYIKDCISKEDAEIIFPSPAKYSYEEYPEDASVAKPDAPKKKLRINLRKK